MLECVINVSEGHRQGELHAIAEAAGAALLDLHTDADHNRAVLTLAGPEVEAAARAVTAEAVDRIDVSRHLGAHPRIGAVDVVPFVPLDGSTLRDAVAARDRYVEWIVAELRVPCFLYGPERALPEIRRWAFSDLLPDAGPPLPHRTAGAVCAGARQVLVAYNLWLQEASLDEARAIAATLRRTSDRVRTLALDLGGQVQVSMNLLDPLSFGPEWAYDEVASHAAVARAELVGLVPAAVLDAVPASRWPELDLEPSRTIEDRIAHARRLWHR